jgi:hypothetical protein
MIGIDIPEEQLLNDGDIVPIVAWCSEHCGPIGIQWNGYYDGTDRVFRFSFREERVALLFVLKWR